MIPRHIAIRGLTSLREIDLDLDRLPEGLICVTGENGAGKSTLMEALGPAALYRRFPSRESRRGLLDVATCRDAVLDVTWDFDGRTVRVLHELDPEHGGGRGKAQAFLWLDGEAATDGRIPDYDEAIRATFPPASVMLAGAYSAQGGAGDFATLPQSERRDLFAHLLGLDALQALSTRSKDHRKRLDAAAGELDRREARLLEDERRDVDLRAQEAGGAADVERLRVVAEASEVAARTAETHAQALAAELAAAERGAKAAADRRRAAEARLAAARDALAKARTTLDAAPAHVSAEALAALDAEAQRHAHLTADRDRARAEWTAAQSAERAADAVRRKADERASASIAEHTRLAALLGAATPTRDPAVLRDLLAAADTAEREAKAARDAATFAGRVPEVVEHDLDRARRDAELVGRVPCRGQTLCDIADFSEIACGSCELLVGATRARDRIAPLEAELAASEAAGLAFAAATATLTAAQAARATVAQEITRAERLEDLRRQVTEAHSRAALDREAEQDAQAAHTAASDQLAQTVARGQTVRRDLDALGDAPARARDAHAAETARPLLVERVATADREAAAAQHDLDETPLPVDLADQRTAAATASTAARLARATAKQDADALQRATIDVSRVTGAREAMGDLAARRVSLDAARGAVGLRRSGFVLVEQATGRDGIQALEIDAAGPQVSALATELLSECYGGRFAVELRTLREAEGNRKERECFDLLVHDGRAGGARVFEQLSGGEKVIVSEALKIAISVFSARRAGVLRTLWRDEADGRLDPERAAAYPRMLRAALQLGGFHRIYFVSHRPDVQAQADGAIIVAGGTARIGGE